MPEVELLKIFHGTGAPPATRVNGGLFVSQLATEAAVSSTNNTVKHANLYFDLGGMRYIVAGDSKLTNALTIGGQSFDGTAPVSVDTWSYTFGSGANNGYISVTPYKNGVAQTAQAIQVKGLASNSAAWRAESYFLTTTGTAAAAKKLISGNAFTISDGTNTISYGTTETGASAYVGSKLITTNSSSSVTQTTSALTNGNVYLNGLMHQVNSNTGWIVNGSIKISGTSGVSVSTDTSGNIVITGTTYTPAQLKFINGSSTTTGPVNYDGSVAVEIGYNTIGAASAESAITGVSFGTDNKTLKLSRGGSLADLTTTLPATAAINISGNATTATTATHTAGHLIIKASGTTIADFNGEDTEANITYAALGVVPESYLPASVKERLVAVADETALKALTTTTVQAGDVVRNQATDQLYYVVNYSDRTAAEASLDNTAKTLSFVNFTAGIAALADKATATVGKLTFSTAGSATASYFDGHDATISYNSIGAAANTTVITGASFDTDNKTLKLARGNGSLGAISVALPATAAINISGKATTAGTADKVANTIILNNNETTVSFDGSQTSSTFYAGNKIIVTTVNGVAPAAGSTNGSVYLATVKQVNATTWAQVNKFQITGGSDIKVTSNSSGNITIAHSTSAPTAGTENATTWSLLGGSDGTFTAHQIAANSYGHVTSYTPQKIILKKLTYTSNYGSEGIKIGTFSDGTAANNIDLYVGIPWDDWDQQ